MNRWRLSDYRSLHDLTGWRVVDEASVRGRPANLHKVPLASRFAGYDEADLLVLKTTMTSVPSGSR